MSEPIIRDLPTLDEVIVQYQRAFEASNIDLPEDWQSITTEMSQCWCEFKSRYNCDTWQDKAMIQAYLECPDSLGIAVNCQRYFEADPATSVQLERAVKLCVATYELYRSMEQISTCEERNIKLDSTPFLRILGSERAPGVSKDLHKKTEYYSHFMAMYRGNFFKIPLSVDPGDVMSYLLGVMECQSPECYVGLGTILERPRWAYWKEKISNSHFINSINFKEISNSLFVLCLDNNKIVNTHDFVKCVRDTYKNRYFDKSMQLICFASGDAGLSYEHSFADGHHINQFAREVYRRSLQVEVDNAEIKRVSPLHWIDVPDEFVRLVQRKETDAKEAMKHSFFFDSTIDTNLCQRLKILPDAVLQLLLQTVALRCSGRMVSASEAIHMRHTKGGRYETINTLSQHSKEFAIAWSEFIESSNQKQLASGILQRLQAASDSHKLKVIRCKKGHEGLLAPRSFFTFYKCKVNRDLRVLESLLYPELATSNPGFGGGIALATMNDSGDKLLASYGINGEKLQIEVKVQGSWTRYFSCIKETLHANWEEISSFIKDRHNDHG
ncbi:choline/carnitine O-acyltransferase [Pseudobacteriovorax antillogorgiicola]|uniref:Choline/Carnitine o-acyltransferase n=1 Tax=Pseudobacteriovorax antillogorgiicola TaxID=1513793 RepID=A0A1Y6CNW5_9BACT|nr:choline/carnitine O-acyltransferase [Pseudobacteriovorax antillogorgiicola]TCS43651.1 choline/carnitine o-acyltransferase [Pseudobacteriovorax antillogorgiicola]SMF79885.1 Choline/Carnitine o-acyltransferase [Pseudobacteriovorax antillogorgiicola]